MENFIKQILEGSGAKLLRAGGYEFAATPKDFALHDLEKFEAEPRRIRARGTFTRLADFAAYVNRFKRPSTTIFINPKVESLTGSAPIATASIDYHAAGDDIDASAHAEADSETVLEEKPSHRTHTANFVATMSPAFELLTALDGKLLAQDEFAQRLRDLQRFCAQPAGAELLEVIRTLTLTSKGDYTSHHDDVSGSVRLKYDVQVDARAGTQERTLNVPSTIKFAMPILLGSAVGDITTELIYRTPAQSGGKVQLGLRIPERKWLEQEIIDAVSKDCKDLTGCMTLVGSVE